MKCLTFDILSNMSEQIVELAKIPEEFRSAREEANLVTYKDFHILVASNDKDEVLGSIRLGRRVNDPNFGLVTDLLVDEESDKKNIEISLIHAAEQKLSEMGIKKVDTVALDGIGHVRHFYNEGYKPLRRTVFISWDLTQKIDLEVNPEFEIKTFEIFDKELVDVIVNSLQPYWTVWKEKATKEQQSQRVEELLRNLFARKDYRVFGALQDKKLVGLVDVRDKAPNLVFGVCIRRDFGGRKLGSTLLAQALSYLSKSGFKSVSTVSTSGLDDYDPQIYLYTLSGAGRIEKEYIGLTKDL